MKPNILLIYTDQQRYDTIHALGNCRIKTPNLDRLTREGLAFTHATTPSPVCLANRWSLHSGQWTSTHGCTSNHHRAARPPTDLVTMLREGGYITGLSGKNHSFLISDDFDLCDENPALESHPDWSDYLDWVRYRRQHYPRLAEEPVPTSVTAEHAKTESALHFINACAEDNQPFFLWLSYLYPHTPYEAPEPYFSLYEDLPSPQLEPHGLAAAGKPFRQQFHQRNNDAIIPFTATQVDLMRRIYYGMVTMIDGEIGRILDLLDERGLSENTLLVFTSDHGDYQGDHGLIAKSPALYDALTRVPFIVRWPSQIDCGRIDDRFASHIDLMPTFAAAADLPCPEQAQGVNLLPYLQDGGAGEPIRPYAISEYGVPGEPYDEARLRHEGLQDRLFTNPADERLSWEGNPVSLAGRIRMIRSHDWKLIAEAGAAGELYNLRTDAHELTNLWDNRQHQHVKDELQLELRRWLASISLEEKA